LAWRDSVNDTFQMQPEINRQCGQKVPEHACSRNHAMRIYPVSYFSRSVQLRVKAYYKTCRLIKKATKKKEKKNVGFIRHGQR
jgi:hypothetical protein